MFIPIHDGMKLVFVRRAFVTLALVAINSVIFAAIFVFVSDPGETVHLPFGMIPASLTGSAQLAPELAIIPAWLTPLTSLFIHGNIWHLLANILFLWVFGDNVEDAMGNLRFLVFYLLCGLAACMTFVLISPASQSPLIGASGAVSGVASAYVLLYPRARVIGLVLNWIPLAAPAILALGIWAVFQLVAALTSQDAGVAWWAHLGGIAAGALLLPLFKRREIKLFDTTA